MPRQIKQENVRKRSSERATAIACILRFCLVDFTRTSTISAFDSNCPKSKHVSRAYVVDVEIFRLLHFWRIAYGLLKGKGESMRAHWERTLVVATLAIAIVVCLWGIKILLAA
jgi:hypothetical protein